MTIDEKFRQVRRLTSLWNFTLNLLQDIRLEHDAMVERLGESLGNMEDFCEARGVPVELCHLTNYARFLDDDRLKYLRKKILDHGNDLKREIELEVVK